MKIHENLKCALGKKIENKRMCVKKYKMNKIANYNDFVACNIISLFVPLG